MNIIKNILDNHKCKCYDIDEPTNSLFFIGKGSDCCTLNPAVAEITGFLITNNIEYVMDSKNNIKLVLETNNLFVNVNS